MNLKTKDYSGAHIVQIISVADPVWAVYREEEGGEYWEKMVVAALVEYPGITGRWVQYVSIGDDGLSNFPEEVATFDRYERPGKLLSVEEVDQRKSL